MNKIKFNKVRLALILCLSVLSTQSFSQTKYKKESSSIGTYRKEGIDVVQRRVFRKAKRHELALDLGVSPDNQFLFYEYIQGRYAYHFREGFAFEASYSRVFNQERNIIDDLKDAQCRPGITATLNSTGAPTNCAAELNPGPDPAENIIFGNFVFSPIYGKFALFSKKIYHFDWYFLGGVGYFMNQRSNNIGFNVGTGIKMFLNKSTAFRVDFRNFTVREDAPFNKISNNRVYSLGLSVFLPGQK